MTVYYLDTSAINCLLRNPARASIVSYLTAFPCEVRLSALNVVELAATGNSESRTALLSLANELSCGRRPLEFPSDLMRIYLNAYAAGESNAVITLSEEHDGLWVVLREPETIENVDRFEVLEWKSQQERWYLEMYENGNGNGRLHLQYVVTNLSAMDRQRVRRHPMALLRHYWADSRFIEDSFAEFFSRCGHPDTFRGRVHEVLGDLEPWMFYFAAIGYGIFLRCVQENNYGRCGCAGSIDTQQAIYLAFCDVFVTADSGQRRIMKPLTRLGRIPRRVISFNELKQQV